MAYALSVIVGRATRLAGGELALVWPAAAVAIIWLLAARSYGRRACLFNVAVLAVLNFGTNLATGASMPLSAWFVMVNVALAVVSAAILTYHRDEVPLRDPADFARLVVAVSAGTVCAALLATAYMVYALQQPPWQTFALFAVRNGATALLGVAAWLRMRDVTWKRPQVSAAALAEALLVVLVVGSVFIWAFWLNSGVPLAFLTLLPAVWVALRYSTTVSTVFLLAAGIWIIYATLLDRGVFIVPNVQTRALLAQAMVGSLTIVVLTLSLYRDSSVRLVSQLQLARDQADRDSELFGAVLDSIHDSVLLIDPAGDVVLQNVRASVSGIVDSVASAARRDSEPSGSASPAPKAPRDIVIPAEQPRVVELTTAPLVHQPLFQVVAYQDVTEERKTARALREARDLFAGVLHAASEQAIIGTAPDGRITVFNNGAERLLGWTEAEMLGGTPMAFHDHAEVCSRATELGIPVGFGVFVHNVTPERAEVREWTYVRRDGSNVTVSLAVSQITNTDGSCGGYIGVATDITQQKAAKQALAESEERFRLAFDTAPMGMFMFEPAPRPNGRITRCNQAMADFLGRSPTELLEIGVTELVADHRTSGSVALDPLLALHVGQHYQAETAFQRADGATVWGSISASIIASGGAGAYGMCLVEDITGRKRVEAELQHLAMHDQLTGLPNRVLFMGRVEHALAAAEQRGSGRVGLIFLDLDRFKAVNDTWGHGEGDNVLKAMAERILTSIRPGDTAARLGGDEFAVLCPSVSGIRELDSVAERLQDTLRRPVEIADHALYDQLSVSAGAVLSESGCTAESLLQRADMLMYQAKKSGRGRVTIGDPLQEAVVVRAVQLTRDLEQALPLRQLALQFQPIMNLQRGECVAAEALLRWSHPKWGLLAPDEFLDLAESSCQMPAIGRYVLNEACRQAVRWGGVMAAAAVHVNVSPRELADSNFRVGVINALRVTGLAPHRLVLEITESHVGQIAESANDDLDALRRTGVRVAIDDFGAGFSGLSRIVALPLDILKIDKQFIAGLGHDVRCEAITRAVIGLGTSLGLEVIAEGIERPDQQEALVEWGCELGQGFLFGDIAAVCGQFPAPDNTPAD
ncbi:EAL domain-containing protein [Mycobacterium sp. EPa45]|uniref:bifunctional diguanylate cyclase/phosphodiesterase n=1 Tax=Mycobacterium sp. EPa45 TaxID=1545728 RepID=UPI001F29CEEA|nr:EAL domain-containing protein [Mycobacterium sp. EPa45]